MFLTGSCGRGVGREMKLSLKCLKFATGPRGRAETSTRSTPNSGSCLILTFVLVLSFVCLQGVEPTFMYYVCCISFELCVSHSFWLSVFLAVLPLLPSLPGYFPTQMSCLCWEHVSVLLPPTPPSSHTGCHMAPSTTFCMKAPVSTLALVTSLRSGCCLVGCLIKGLFEWVNVCHPSYCQTLSWTRHRRWSLLWTLPVEWPFYTRLNRWSLDIISIARVSWWE